VITYACYGDYREGFRGWAGGRGNSEKRKEGCIRGGSGSLSGLRGMGFRFDPCVQRRGGTGLPGLQSGREKKSKQRALRGVQ